MNNAVGIVTPCTTTQEPKEGMSTVKRLMENTDMHKFIMTVLKTKIDYSSEVDVLQDLSFTELEDNFQDATD